jgi:hypothetical protein
MLSFFRFGEGPWKEILKSYPMLMISNYNLIILSFSIYDFYVYFILFYQVNLKDKWRNMQPK